VSEARALRAFVNGTGVNVPSGATILDAVRVADAALAEAVMAGTRAIADSRGLVIDSNTPVTGGTVLRVVSSRAKRADDAEPAEDV
jgi:hypothetical protein